MLLARYSQIMQQIEALRAEAAEVESQLKSFVGEVGQVEDFGYRAYFRPGRKSTDHEAAAKAANVPSVIIEKFSTVKVSVAWARVTKEAGVNTADFTTQGESEFVIERVEVKQ